MGQFQSIQMTCDVRLSPPEADIETAGIYEYTPPQLARIRGGGV